MDDSLSDYWRDVKQAGQQKRACNRKASADYLRERSIAFTTHNDGAHLIVERGEGFVDFWPGTGRWICRSGQRGFGVKGLVDYIRKDRS